MPYFVNTYRTPKPGQFTAVVNGVAESLKSTGRGGFVSIPISPRMPGVQSMSVVGTVSGFETLDDVDAFFDGLMENDMAGFAARDELGALCERFNLSVSSILTPPLDLPDNFDGKIISRTQVLAKPGKAAELIELLLEWIGELDFRGAGILSVMLGGQAGLVRYSQIVESLQANADVNAQIVASPRMQKLVELTSGPGLRGVSRITHFNQP
jgi:hypothetical protein